MMAIGIYKPLTQSLREETISSFYNEEIYNQYYDSVGNYHFTGTKTGKHIIRLENAVVPNELFLNGEERENE